MKKMVNISILGSLLLCLGMASPADATIRYVKAGAAGNGTAWSNAYGDLQQALSVSGQFDSVWVAVGTYTPGSQQGNVFQIPWRVQVIGGFFGTPGSEGDPDERDQNPSTNGTILSGEIGDPGAMSDNSYCVVSCTDGDALTILDGFTITGASRHGVQVSGGSPTFQNLRIVGNQNYDESLPYYDRDGAGMYLVNGAQPTLTHCAFESNEAESQGGGLYIAEGCRPFLTACQFRDNLAGLGGGIWNGSGQTIATLPRLSNCLFRRNGYRPPPETPVGSGVAIYNHDSADIVVRDSVFVDNVAVGSGGGTLHSAASTYTNCIFAHNESWASGGVGQLVDSGVGRQTVFANCRFVGNTSAGDGGALHAKVGLRSSTASSPAMKPRPAGPSTVGRRPW